MDIFNKQNYHFIGIGGIGVSAIARMFQIQGKKVSGSDASKSEITDDLEKLGIKVAIGQKAENIPPDTEVVIYTIAIAEDNQELKEARNRKLICMTYPEALGELSKQMYTIAVSGTHGKTTTTAMIGYILERAGLDPTIIVGSKILGENSNFVSGKSKYLVVEACEYKRSFLNLHPKILAITNIEEDHLDYYKDLADIKKAFSEMAAKVPKDGFIVTRSKEKNIAESISQSPAKIIDSAKTKVGNSLIVSGKHNELNAQIAVKTAEILGVENEKAVNYLETFKGTWRRLEYKGEKNGNIFYDDYAHHPTEVSASLNALRGKHPDKNIVCVFEPHQQSRTKLFFDDFVKSLSLADKVFVAPIHIARETEDPLFSNQNLAEAVSRNVEAKTVANKDDLKKYIQEFDRQKKYCVVLMGAGNIYKWTNELI